MWNEGYETHTDPVVNGTEYEVGATTDELAVPTDPWKQHLKKIQNFL